MTRTIQPRRRFGDEKVERKSVVTRRQILAAARTLLDDANIVDLKVDDIVREAGVAVGTFYLYFPDKYELMKELAREMVERRFEQDFVRMDHRIPRFERIRMAIHANLVQWQEHAGLLASLHQLALMRKDFEELMEVDLRGPFNERLRLEIESSIERGYARPIDSRVAADVLGTTITWSFMRWIGMNRPPHNNADFESLVDNLALLWYRALFAADPPVSESAAWGRLEGLPELP